MLIPNAFKFMLYHVKDYRLFITAKLSSYLVFEKTQTVHVHVTNLIR